MFPKCAGFISCVYLVKSPKINLQIFQKKNPSKEIKQQQKKTVVQSDFFAVG